MSDLRTERTPVVWTSSAREQYLYLIATFGDPGSWAVLGQGLTETMDGRAAESVEIRRGDQGTLTVLFVAIGDDDGLPGPEEDDGTGFLDMAMERATTFAIENPPQHPGTIARFPVPSASYANALAVPMAVIAVGPEGRSLYAPPRIVVTTFPGLAPVGVGEYPGFEPENWPPDHLGTWPPQATVGMSEERLQALVGQFSACWQRVLAAWFDRGAPAGPHLASDIRRALAARQALDLPGMMSYYDQVNPVFERWLDRTSERGDQAGTGD